MMSARDRAASAFGECLPAGYALGGALAFVAVLATALLRSHADGIGVILLYGLLASGFGGVVGLFVGFWTGVALYWLVRLGEPRLGAPVVARAIPILAAAMTLPVALLIGSVAGVVWLVSVVVLDVVLTLLGARVIARHYLRRCESAHLH